MRVVAWDTWAFVEHELDGPRAEEVKSLAEEVDLVVTVRDAVAETFNYLVHKTGRTEIGWAWWEDVRASRPRVLDPPLGEVLASMEARPRGGGLSFTDYALAWACQRERIREVATEDREFLKLGLVPLFARR